MKKILSLDNLFLLTILCMPLYLVKFSFLPTNVFELLAFFAIIVFMICEKNLMARIKDVPGTLAFGIFLVLAGTILSILFNDNLRTGLGIFKSWFLSPIIFSCLLYMRADSKKFVEKIFLAIFFSSALVGIVAAAHKIWGKVTFDDRLTAFYLSPNHLAMYLAPGIFFGLYFIAKFLSEKKYSKEFFLYVFLLVIIFFSFYFTYSYGAWLAVFISLLVMSVISFGIKNRFFAGIFIFTTVLALFSQSNTQKFLSLAEFSERSSFASRTMIWEASFLMIKQHPVLGIGAGNFQNTYLSLQKHFPPYLEWAVPQPHNIFLAFWIQTGILGFLGFMILLFSVFKKIFFTIRHKKNAALAAPLLGFFLYTVLHGLVDTPYWKNDLAFLFWICAFLVFSLYKLEVKPV